MRRLSKLLLGGGALFAGWVAWGVYARRSAESVPYERLRTLDGVELRRYPETLTVETTAPDETTAFRRLFRYISGANVESKSVSMTTPVETRGASVAMTTPVRSRPTAEGSDDKSDHTVQDDERTVRDDERTAQDDRRTVQDTRRRAWNDGSADSDAATDRVRMAFYLPADYSAETAPEPTDPAVTLRVEPETTVAVLPFSWYTPAWRVERMERRLLSALRGAAVAPLGEPYLLRYDAPWTPPFLRRNEVAVAVAAD